MFVNITAILRYLTVRYMVVSCVHIFYGFVEPELLGH